MKKKLSVLLAICMLFTAIFCTTSFAFYGEDGMTLYVNPINDYINVRSQPAHNSALAGTVQIYETMAFNGQTATGYGSDGTLHYWYFIVSSSGVAGWVRSDLVTTVPTGYGTIVPYGSTPASVLYVNPINDYINVRSQPAHNSALMGTCQVYEIMYFYGQTGTGYGSDGTLHYWYNIVTSSGVSGWVRDDLVSFVPYDYSSMTSTSGLPVATFYVGPGNSYLNVRTQPTHNSALAGTVQSYEVMYYYGNTQTGLGSDGAYHTWYNIRTSSGVVGWVRSDLVVSPQW